MRARWLSASSALVLFAVSCTGDSGGGDEGPAFVDAGAILEVVPAADVDSAGNPVEPSFRFSPSEPQVAVVAGAGARDGTPMTFTWFQLTAGGETELFVHTVEVASGDRAFSIGTSPGLLAEGVYRVDVTLEGETQAVTFDVVDPTAAASPSAPAGTTGAEASSAGPPESGASGAVGGSASIDLPQQGAAGALELEPSDFAADAVETTLTTIWDGGAKGAPNDLIVELTATQAGESLSRRYTHPVGSPLEQFSTEIKPCRFPSGSDLPGTTITFVAGFVEGTTGTILGSPFTVSLGPDTKAPGITANLSPPSGSRVEAGDEIAIDVTAQEIRTGASWQQGVEYLEVTSDAGGTAPDPVSADAPKALPCDQKQWSLAMQGTYTVPEDPPASFKLCAVARDFAGNRNPKCATYFTADT